MSKKVARLYEQFQPENYQLELRLDRENMTFWGRVIVRGKKTGRPSQRLTFHQKELKITDATIVKRDKKGVSPIKIARINNQNSLDEVRLHAEGMIYPGEYTVTMEFEGKITKPMHGMYPCFFKHDGQEKKLLATQFESNHAHEAFPCIDEPEAKATFDLTVGTPGKETTASNTPVKSQEKDGDTYLTTFETTPIMSAYLLAFVTGEMGYKEATAKNGVKVRAYATPDNVGLTQHGLDAAVKILEFFENYFDVPYPLKKLDMVALPDFSVGAMENWGLITYRETTMLADPDTSSIESKQLVALVVAHEISHQWFGNLVTMKWWNDLWLNESFANLMEYVVIDAVWPEWHIWEQFVSYETGSAKRRDSLVDVQPIHCEVSHPDEIETLFDPAIVYSKGGSILHMLMHYVGEPTFRRGLKLYFDKHAYGNTEAEDLWQAIGTASGQNISDFMDGWLQRPGYPVVSIDWKPGDATIKLTQQRFLSDPSTTDKTKKPWQVPLAVSQDLDQPLLTKLSAQAKTEAPAKPALLFNHDGHSYFLPRYINDAHVQQIVDDLKAGQVDTLDRLLLLDNYTMLQRSDFSSTVELLELLAGYEHETSESVWGAMSIAIGEARRLVEKEEVYELKLNTMIRQLAEETAIKLGWEDKKSDDARTLRLRGLSHSLSIGAKSETIIKQALERFTAFKKPGDLPASTRAAIYYAGVRYGKDADFKRLLLLHNDSHNADEKEELASALTSAKDPQQIQELIPLLTSGVVRRQDLLHWFVWLMRNRYSRTTAWQWLVDNWDWIEHEFSSEKNYGFFARYAGGVFSHDDELKQFKKFFEPKKSVVALSQEITLAEQDIKSRIAWRKRNETAVKAWLKKQA